MRPPCESPKHPDRRLAHSHCTKRSRTGSTLGLLDSAARRPGGWASWAGGMTGASGGASGAGAFTANGGDETGALASCPFHVSVGAR